MRRLATLGAMLAVAVAAGVLVRAADDDDRLTRAPATIARFEEPASPRVRAPSGNTRQAAPPVLGTLGDEPREIEPAPSESVPGQLVVRYRPGAGAGEIAALYRRAGVRPIRQLPLDGTEVVRVRPGTTVGAARAVLEGSATVAYAEPDFIYSTAATVPNDPRFYDLWGLDSTTDADIRATDAWDFATGDSSVRVAIVDTGVAYDHPDLGPNIAVNPGEAGAEQRSNGIDDDGNGYPDDWRGWDWVGGDNDARDANGHGTHVAGTIGAAGNNALGVSGVNWRVGVVPLRALNADGSGSTSTIAAAFSYAGEAGIDVVNASLGGSHYSRTLLASITSNPDTLYVVAAGNDGSDNDQTPSYPCNYAADNIICVTATTRSDTLASFANYGANNVDLAAPGSGILSTAPSFTTPFDEGFETDLVKRWEATGWSLSRDAYGGYATAGAGGSLLPLDATMTLVDPIALAGLSECHLEYSLKLASAPGVGKFTIEIDDGATWTRVSSYSGDSNGWVRAGASLAAAGDRSSLRLRARLTSNSDALAQADVDDFEITCLGPFSQSDAYGYASGTSMATPHVAGAAALLRSTAPAASPAQVKNALLGSVARRPAFSGKTVTGGRLDLLGALSLLRPDLTIETGPGEAAARPTPSVALTPEATAALPTDDLPTPTPTPSAAPAPRQNGDPQETPAAIPTVQPTVQPTPTAVTRTIGLAARKHLVLRGRVLSSLDICAQRVPVQLFRNGAPIARTRTNENGRFRVSRGDRPGRYLAVALGQGGLCKRAISSVVRHAHGGALLQPQPTDPGSGCWNFGLEETQMIEETNAAREALGLARLRPDPELSKAARVHTAEMVEEGSLSHTTSDEFRSRITNWTSLGENVGVGSTPASLQTAFMNSPSHRDNILENYTHIGVGSMTAGDRLWVTVIFQARENPGTTLPMPSECS